MKAKGRRPRGVVCVTAGAGDIAAVASRIEAALADAPRSRTMRERLDALHARLLAGDRSVETDIWDLVAPELRRRLRCRAPAEPPEVIESAVEDALLVYFLAPERYDARRGDIFGWLAAIGGHKVIDAQRARRRVTRREVPSGIDLERAVPPRAAGDDGRAGWRRGRPATARG
jgi:hypothetical protein